MHKNVLREVTEIHLPGKPKLTTSIYRTLGVCVNTHAYTYRYISLYINISARLYVSSHASNLLQRRALNNS